MGQILDRKGKQSITTLLRAIAPIGGHPVGSRVAGASFLFRDVQNRSSSAVKQ